MKKIEFCNINLKFGRNIIFKDFNLSVKKGEKIIIHGKSGCGKTTLLKLLLGFCSPDSGIIKIDNKELIAGDFRNHRTLFAYVSQDISLRPVKVSNLLKEISFFSNNNFDGHIDISLAEKFDFNLDLLNQNTEKLSGGEKQRLGIIIAIMLNRPIFLLDEVTSALDHSLKKRVVNYFSHSNKTIISISHDIEWENTGKFREVKW